MLTMQMRPHIAAMLDTYVAQVRERVPENKRAGVTRSIIIRKLMQRTLKRPAESLAYIGRRRFKDRAAVQLRVRLGEGDAKRPANEVCALILEAAYPDGNYPPNPDTNDDPTKEMQP
jgi:hypothetical protein